MSAIRIDDYKLILNILSYNNGIKVAKILRSKSPSYQKIHFVRWIKREYGITLVTFDSLDYIDKYTAQALNSTLPPEGAKEYSLCINFVPTDHQQEMYLVKLQELKEKNYMQSVFYAKKMYNQSEFGQALDKHTHDLVDKLTLAKHLKESYHQQQMKWFALRKPPAPTPSIEPVPVFGFDLLLQASQSLPVENHTHTQTQVSLPVEKVTRRCKGRNNNGKRCKKMTAVGKKCRFHS